MPKDRISAAIQHTAHITVIYCIVHYMIVCYESSHYQFDIPSRVAGYAAPLDRDLIVPSTARMSASVVVAQLPIATCRSVTIHLGNKALAPACSIKQCSAA